MTTSRITKGPGSGNNAELRVRELKAQLDRTPFDINLRLTYASALEEAGKAADAVKILQDTVEKARRNLGVSYCTLGTTLMKVGKPEEALRSFDTAIEADPSNSAFYLSNKASALKKIGLVDKANALYQDLLSRPDLAKSTRRIVVDNLKENR